MCVRAHQEDRYHATAVDTETYLARCLTYIDLNMVRAGVVRHPKEWAVGGYREIQSPPTRYAIVNRQALLDLLGIRRLTELQQAHAGWVAEALRGASPARDPNWSQSLAVGRRSFVEAVHSALGIKARYRKVCEDGDAHILREPSAAYVVHSDGQNPGLSDESAYF